MKDELDPGAVPGASTIRKLSEDMKATLKRTLVKSLAYRMFVVISTYVMLLVTGQDMTQAILPTVIINGLWTISYFVNERIWNRIDWGKE